MYDSLITLIKRRQHVNAMGDIVQDDPVRREVYAEVKSITRAEFYQAAGTGFKPSLTFELADYLDYDMEDRLEYTDDYGYTDIYSVIRTYRSGSNALEIIASRGVDVDAHT